MYTCSSDLPLWRGKRGNDCRLLRDLHEAGVRAGLAAGIGCQPVASAPVGRSHDGPPTCTSPKPISKLALVSLPSLCHGSSMTKTGNITIRPLAASDRTEWAEMWQAYLAFYETSVTPEVYDTTFARLLGDDPQDFSCLLAEVDGRPVGLVHFLFHRHAWKVENVCYLQDLFARPEARCTGVGRALIEAVYDRADAAGAPGVYWLTQEFNHTARQLYDRIGTLTPFLRYNRS